MVQIIRDTTTAAALLKPPRLAIVKALREPASASSLATSLGLSRQVVGYHVRDLEKVGLVKLVATRRRRGCVERVVQATARRFLLSPEVVGELGTIEAEELLTLGRFGWLPLAAIAAQTVKDLGRLRENLGDEVPALMIPGQLRFSSPSAFTDFIQELSEEVTRLIAKYHDEEADGPRHWLFLGAYPEM